METEELPRLTPRVSVYSLLACLLVLGVCCFAAAIAEL